MCSITPAPGCFNLDQPTLFVHHIDSTTEEYISLAVKNIWNINAVYVSSICWDTSKSGFTCHCLGHISRCRSTFDVRFCGLWFVNDIFKSRKILRAVVVVVTVSGQPLIYRTIHGIKNRNVTARRSHDSVQRPYDTLLVVSATTISPFGRHVGAMRAPQWRFEATVRFLGTKDGKKPHATSRPS